MMVMMLVQQATRRVWGGINRKISTIDERGGMSVLEYLEVEKGRLDKSMRVYFEDFDLRVVVNKSNSLNGRSV